MQIRLVFWAAVGAALAATLYVAPAAAATGDAGTQGLVKVAAVADQSGGNVEKKACDAKWGTYKAEQKVHGWKAYFTFMAGCM